jgi:hypothetical protein
MLPKTRKTGTLPRPDTITEGLLEFPACPLLKFVGAFDSLWSDRGVGISCMTESPKPVPPWRIRLEGSDADLKDLASCLTNGRLSAGGSEAGLGIENGLRSLLADGELRRHEVAGSTLRASVFLVGRIVGRIGVIRGIGIGRIVTGRIAEFRRFVLEESWRLKRQRTRWPRVLHLRLPPALPDLVSKCLLGKGRQFGALREEDENFAVTHPPIALGDAQKFSRRIESVHSHRNDIPAGCRVGFHGPCTLGIFANSEATV